ncbi:hypothetical protein BD626DRAFT_475446 [Schizophyllum amplum]|uniref:Uncharacterized protein n=1 Tax=Schizophyllum amplum TaxID=97359 RepID=A0A550CYF2_9AGAR|nr:hypothetical protein BD626DRAFT_475446 [Auriculariopsis ampla]
MESRYFRTPKRPASASSGDERSGKKQKKTSDCDLRSLLDFSHLDSESAIASRFDEIASALLHAYLLVVHSGTSETCFTLLELEFYLHKPQCHEDPFVHRTEEQRELGRWYFHRAPGRGTTAYRGGTRKGLDLTFGDATAYGGILLRSIQRLDTAEIVCGPSLLVDKIVFLSNASTLTDLVGTKWGGDTSAFTQCGAFLRARDDTEDSFSRRLCRTPRVGLELSTASRGAFVIKPYRYIASFDSPLKSKAQTFVGAVQYCLEKDRDETTTMLMPDDVKAHSSRLHDQRLSAQLVGLTALNATLIERYLRDYRGGFDNAAVSTFAGRKGVAASPSACLSMMGALYRSMVA